MAHHEPPELDKVSMDLLSFSRRLLHELVSFWMRVSFVIYNRRSYKLHSDLFWTCLLPLASVLALLGTLHNPIPICCDTLDVTQLSYTILIFFFSKIKIVALFHHVLYGRYSILAVMHSAFLWIFPIQLEFPTSRRYEKQNCMLYLNTGKG